MMRLTLLAHGATIATRTPAFPLDEPLEPKALAATAALGAAFAGAGAMSSPALRTRQTAEALGLAPRLEPALRDCDCGRWSGLAIAEVASREPEAFAAFTTDAFARPHGGESIADLAQRTAAWLDSLPFDDGHLVAVTHAAIVRSIVVGLVAAPLAAFWRVDVPPLSATELVSDGRRWLWRASRLRC